MRRFLLLACVIFTLLLSSCREPSGLDQEQALHVAAMTGPITMNPIFLRDAASAEVSALMHTNLLVTDPETLEPTPRLISSWELKEDKLTYRFTLHEDAQWSDGKPITAYDVAFTMRVICHPDYTGWLFLPLRYVQGAERYKAEHASAFADGEISGIQVIDEKTLTVTLKEPYAPFLSMLTFPPVPSHIIGNVAVSKMEEDNYSLQIPVSSGPYLLEEWNPDEYVHVKANSNYFLGAPSIENIYYRFIANAEAQLIELLAGKIDVIPTAVKVEDVEALRANPEVNIYTNSRLVYDYIAINTAKNKSPLKDKRIRRALSLLVDRDYFVKNVLLGYGYPLYGPLLPIQFAFDEAMKKAPANLEEARKLLVDAGYQKLQFKLIINVGNLVRENVALLFKEEAAKIGIDIQISLLEWESFLAAIKEGNFDLAILGRSVEADPDLTFHWHSESQGNAYGYKNSTVDALLTQALRSTDKNERTKLYRQAQQLIVNDIPALWLYARQAVHATTVNLHGFKPHPDSLFHNVHEWTLGIKGDAP